MKFSVLLPTRNRLELLRYAIETVRRQDYDDWEIIVSDNYSEDDIAGYIQALGEPRIQYYRTQRFIPVTDNWNNALGKSTGEYVIMLGDDDCLMKGFFSTIKELVETYKNPDLIYSNAYLYAYPGVLPDFPNGFLRSYSYASFFRSAKKPFWLSKKQALDLVRQSMNFKMGFTYNMQHSIINRNIIDRLRSKGSFFQSPYPDFYATNVLLLKAERILICPYHLVTVGISPKSFGYYFFNKREEEGVEFLKNLSDPNSLDLVRHVVLPGSRDRTSWLIAMETIKANYGSEFNLSIKYNRYRYLQILSFYGLSKIQRTELLKLLRWWEILMYMLPLWLASKLSKLFPRDFRNNIFTKFLMRLYKTPKIDVKTSEHYYSNILDVFEGEGSWSQK